VHLLTVDFICHFTSQSLLIIKNFYSSSQSTVFLFSVNFSPHFHLLFQITCKQIKKYRSILVLWLIFLCENTLFIYTFILYCCNYSVSFSGTTPLAITLSFNRVVLEKVWTDITETGPAAVPFLGLSRQNVFVLIYASKLSCKFPPLNFISHCM